MLIVQFDTSASHYLTGTLNSKRSVEWHAAEILPGVLNNLGIRRFFPERLIMYFRIYFMLNSSQFSIKKDEGSY